MNIRYHISTKLYIYINILILYSYIILYYA